MREGETLDFNEGEALEIESGKKIVYISSHSSSLSAQEISSFSLRRTRVSTDHAAESAPIPQYNLVKWILSSFWPPTSSIFSSIIVAVKVKRDFFINNIEPSPLLRAVDSYRAMACFFQLFENEFSIETSRHDRYTSFKGETVHKEGRFNGQLASHSFLSQQHSTQREYLNGENVT